MLAAPFMQLLEGLAGGTLSVEAVKKKARRVLDKANETVWREQNVIIVVPPKTGRMLVLESPPTAKFKVGEPIQVPTASMCVASLAPGWLAGLCAAVHAC